MSFFQNPFDQEFRGSWILSDRQYNLTFVCPPNRNTWDYQLAYNYEPYDFSSLNTVTLNYAFDINFKNYASLAINVAGSNPAQTQALEVVNTLNSNAIFSGMYVATLYQNDGKNSVLIKSKPSRVKQTIKFYISNSGAETKLGFNKNSGVSELPSYFNRHTIANRFNYSDSAGQLVLLNESDPVDQAIIENAGFDPSDMKADWELLRGRAPGLFTFQKMTIDGSNRITQIIEYPAGALAGDFARKINYTYSGANTNPSNVTEIPYVLQSADLITPP